MVNVREGVQVLQIDSAASASGTTMDFVGVRYSIAVERTGKYS